MIFRSLEIQIFVNSRKKSECFYKGSELTSSYKLLFLGHRSLIKKITQTAVINIVFQRIFIKLDVSYASQHIFKSDRYNF